jgi:glycosyltransferase involved in cell wall biosynthesis
MRIGQFIQTMNITAGGTSTAFLNILGALRTRPEVETLAICEPPWEGDPAWDEIKAYPSRFRCIRGLGRFVRPGPLGTAAVRAVERGEIDLLHIHGLWSPDLLAAGLACLRCKVPCVWEPHGMLIREAYVQKRWKKECFMALGMRRAIAGVSALVFVTADERDHSIIPRAVGPDRIHVVPLPVALPTMPVTLGWRRAARERFGVPQDAPVVVFMGRFHHVKRISMAMRALACCGVPDARLLLFGGGDGEGELRSLAGDLGISDRTTFAGWVRGEAKWIALAAGDILTLNSVHENFGYVAVEALCVGTKPVLTSNLSLARVLGEAGVAVVAEPDEQSLGRGFAEALGRCDWAETLRQGSAWVRAHLTPESVGATLFALYREAIAGRTGTR